MRIKPKREGDREAIVTGECDIQVEGVQWRERRGGGDAMEG